MDCREYRAMISRSRDGELVTRETELLRAHLDQCPECRAFRSALEGLDDFHAMLADPEPPATILPAVLAGIEESGRTGWFGDLFGRIAVPVFSAVILVLGLAAGDSLVSGLKPARADRSADLLELEYLGEYPPESIGDIVFAASEEGVGDE